MTSMSWLNLLTADRFGKMLGGAVEGRTHFERDYDRILFSDSFRRLGGKTQVFPFSGNDHIHNRLTHTLEVASVGRSLGKNVGEVIIQRHSELAEAGLHSSDFGDIVAAACMAHDIGNPPFGHSGEESIGAWFDKHTDHTWLADLNAAQKADLCFYEGNAQGFRIIGKTDMYRGAGGMRLTMATMAAFAKYPQGSLLRKSGAGVSQKKFGFFQSEAQDFATVAEHTGLLPHTQPGSWHRHPLAYLMEAADDICYLIIDVEDGYKLRHFSLQEVRDLLEPLAGGQQGGPDVSANEEVSRLRAKSIGRLVRECIQVFLDNEKGLLDGTFDRSLIDEVPSILALQQIKDMSAERCYNAHEVISILLAGYKVVEDLLDQFVPAVLKEEGACNRFDRNLRDLLPDHWQQACSNYERLLVVTDFIAGMTDQYALNLYRTLTGIALPGHGIPNQ